MKTVRSVAQLREALGPVRRAGRNIGLVPTMGFFHAGHLSLMRRARESCDVVVVSLFVNPAQFGPGEDLEGYPRDEERDLALARDEGVDLVFAPPVDEVYPPGFAASVEVGGLTDTLEGDPRQRGSEHFRGVTTMVTKLFNMVGPDVAYFGQKDAQQALVIQRMAADLDFPAEIAVLETAREPDGLAMSSRNQFLAPEERKRSARMYETLQWVAGELAGGRRDYAMLSQEGQARLVKAHFNPQYLEVRASDLSAPNDKTRDFVVLTAAFMGTTRLIDNVQLRV